MLLHTPIYLGFLTLACAIYWLLRGNRLRKWALLILSALFYLGFGLGFLALLWGLTVATYLAGRQIAKGRNTKTLAALSILLSLSVLGAFKYAGFFLGGLRGSFALLGIDVPPSAGLLLPVGISFYTFQAIAYVVEVYRGHVSGGTSFLDFALYMTYFPKMIAGPIVRPVDFLGQVAKPADRPKSQDVMSALKLLLLGLFKKVVIADSLAGLSEVAFRAAAQTTSGIPFPTPLYLQGFYLYAIEIYADFSGYTDLARASAALLGFVLPENFRAPYFSPTIGAFWNRWHMSLTQWFREYLYFPMTRSLLSTRSWLSPQIVQVLVTMVTMTLIGLWHGAAWTFVAWGAWHGLLLSVERLSKVRISGRWQTVLGTLVTFHLVCVGWVLFRADSFASAQRFLLGLVAFEGMQWIPVLLPPVVLAYALVILLDGWPRDRAAGVLIPARIAAVVVIGSLLLLAGARGGEVRPFLYSQF